MVATCQPTLISTIAIVLPILDPLPADTPTVVDETLTMIPSWWDAPVEPLIRPVTDVNYLASAADRLFLASAAQTQAGGDAGISTKLERWCLDLKGTPSLPAVVSLLHSLDRLDWEVCEPQTWVHLQGAEKAVAAYVAKHR